MVARAVSGVLAAVAAGVALGGAARALMTAVTLAAGSTPSFTWAGTAFVVGLYAAVMVPAGLVAGLTTRRLRWLLPVGGAVFLAVPAAGTAADDLGSTVGFGAVQWLGVGAGVVALFATIAVLPVLTVRLADRFTGRRRAVADPPVRPAAAAR